MRFPLTTLHSAKRLLSLLILACLFLPLSQCSQRPPPDASAATSTADTGPDDLIMAAAVLEDGPLHASQLFVLATFAWPLFTALGFALARRNWCKVALSIFEILAGIASIVYFVRVIAFWGQIRYGGIILLAGYAAYVVLSARALFSLRPPR